MNRLVLSLSALLLATSALGCRPLTKVDRAQSAYESGDYQDSVDRSDDAELLYQNDELPPDYRLRYMAYRGLAYRKLAEQTGNKAYRRKARPWIRKALDAYDKMPEAKDWLDDDVVAELRAAVKGAEPGADEGGGGDAKDAKAP